MLSYTYSSLPLLPSPGTHLNRRESKCLLPCGPFPPQPIEHHSDTHCTTSGFPCSSAGKESTCSVGDLVLIPGLGRSPGEGKGYPLQCSGLESSMDCVVHGVTKSQTRLSDFHFYTTETISAKVTMWLPYC